MILHLIKNPLNFLLSVYFNLRYLPIKQAVRLPIWITRKVKTKHLKKNQLIIKKCRFATILLGSEGSQGMNSGWTMICMRKGGKIIFEGSAEIAVGSIIRCDENALIQLGDNFYCNCNCYFRSTNIIEFGNDCSVGWNVQMNTSDGHSVFHEGVLVEVGGPIIIGSHVWITANVIFAKKSGVAKNCIVAQGAVVTKKICEENCLIGGVPAKVVSQNVDWKA